MTDQKSIHPQRDARTASLAVSATSVELRRSNNHSPGAPPSLRVNVMTVQETKCPKDIEPIRWFLVTTEPVQTRAQLEFIVDAYRTRWVVEEFFSAEERVISYSLALARSGCIAVPSGHGECKPG